MKTEYILNKVIKLNELKNKDELDYQEFYKQFIDDLKNDIRLEIIGKTKNSSMKVRNKKAIAYLKKVDKNRPALKCCDVQTLNNKEYQVFTNSYSAFALAEGDKMELKNINEYNEENKTSLEYLKLDRIFNLEENDYKYNILIDIDKLRYAKKIKTAMVEINFTNDERIYFSTDLLLSAVDILGVDELNLLINSAAQPCLFKNEFNSYALVLPLRLKGECAEDYTNINKE